MNELIKFKEKNKLSWYRIAKDLDIPYQTINNWATGKYKPSVVYQKIILKYINKK